MDGQVMTKPASDLDALTRVEAAEVLRVKPQTLRKWAINGRGPKYSRTGARGGRVIYSAADLAAWMEQQKVDPAAKGTK